MKNSIISLVIVLMGIGVWYLLTQPIAAPKNVQNKALSTEKVDQQEAIELSVERQKNVVSKSKSVPKNITEKTTSQGKTITHFYDYGTYEKLEVNVLENRQLAKKMAQKPKTFKYVGKKPPKNWEVRFYNQFLQTREDENILDQLVAQFQQQAKYIGVTPVELAVAYVQGAIEYDFDKAEKTEFLLQYPYETIYRKKGVCADKTLLLSKLLTLMDYKHVLMEFPKANHMALGLKVPQKYDDFGSGYAFVETTDYANIGEIPKNYIQGIQIQEKPVLIPPKYNGKRTFIQMGDYEKRIKKQVEKYGDAFKYGTSKQKQIAITLKELEQKIESLEAKHDRNQCAESTVKTEVEFQACKALTNEINALIDSLNLNRRAFNAAKRKQ